MAILLNEESSSVLSNAWLAAVSAKAGNKVIIYLESPFILSERIGFCFGRWQSDQPTAIKAKQRYSAAHLLQAAIRFAPARMAAKQTG